MKTYCNPIVLPDYPRGRWAAERKAESGGHFWRGSKHRDFRETADPTVLFHEGKWYLYPSCDMAWVSEDFVSWKHVPIDPPDVGYAPTVVLHRGEFLLTACNAPVYKSKNPLGPFEKIGEMVTPAGATPEHWVDPMLFSDDDGRLYVYYGIGAPGIFGAQLDPLKPWKMITEPKILFSYDPSHLWERVGEFNEDASQSFIEGPWMLKERGRYHLTYAGPGTQWSTYAMGTYVSDAPLGPFTYPERNPILRDTEGLIRGPGHGCLVRGPKNTLWAFYTLTVCSEHIFERRIGVDPAGFDEQGNLFVRGASEIPQWAPGVKERPELGNDTGSLPLTVNKRARASSEREGREAEYAVDNSMRTWWQPTADDLCPRLVVDFRSSFLCDGARILWKERGLDYDNGVPPGPFRYKIDLLVDAAAERWVTVVDATKNETDLLVDVRFFEGVKATAAKLTILGWPKGISPGVIDFCVFGTNTRFGYG